MATSSRISSLAVQRIAEIWRIGSERIHWISESVDCPAGFDWWPGDFCVSVRAVNPLASSDFNGCKVLIRTNFLKNISIDNNRIELLIATISRFSTSTYAWVYPTQNFWKHFEATQNSLNLWLSSSAYIDENNLGWMTDFLANTSIIQPINAQLQSSSLPELLGCGAPDKTKPNSTVIDKLDDMLEVVGEVYAPIGQKPSYFANTGEFEDFAKKYAQSDICFGFGDQAGMTLETPFGSDSALIRFYTNEKHPQLGHGLLVTLQLPWFDKDINIARESAELNFLESIDWTRFPQLGCWHSSESREGQTGVACTLFIPNALYKKGLVAHIAFWFIERARWVRKKKFPNTSDLKMIEILEKRYGKPQR